MSSPTSQGRDQWNAGHPTATMKAVSEAPAAQSAPPPRPKARKARLVLTRVDPWSVMKLSFLLSIALAVMAFIAVVILWSVLDAMGVWDSVGRTVESVTRGSEAEEGVDVMSYVGLGRVMTVTALLSGVNVILMTALCTLGAFLYNLAASLVGGLHVTLTEDV